VAAAFLREAHKRGKKNDIKEGSPEAVVLSGIADV